MTTTTTTATKTSKTSPIPLPTANDNVNNNNNIKTANDIETFNGLISNTTDALRVFDLSRRNMLPRVRRRFTDAERAKIRSGSVFIFEEEESGIRRWTDGRLWSPSRILGNFLIYREIEKGAYGFIGGGGYSGDVDVDGSSGQNHQVQEDHISSLLGGGKVKKVNSKNSNMSPKPNGLLKKTISAKIDGMVHHLIAYFDEKDFIQSHKDGHANEANTHHSHDPTMNELRKIPIPTDLLLDQTFRKAPLIGNCAPEQRVKIAPKCVGDDLILNDDSCMDGLEDLDGLDEAAEDCNRYNNNEYEITNSITNYYKHPFQEQTSATIISEDDENNLYRNTEYPFLSEVDPILPNYFKD